MLGCASPSAAYNASSAAPYPILQRIEPATVRPLEGGTSCVAQSSAGIVAHDGGCTDLGVGREGGYWHQLAFLPRQPLWRRAADENVRGLSDKLQAQLTKLQTGGVGCNGLPLHTVAELPTIGFCATIEYGMLSLARAASSGTRVVFGRSSAPTWSSQWLCGPERSIACYFNISATCCPEQTSFDAGAALEGSDGSMAFGGRGKPFKGAKMGAPAKLATSFKIGRIDVGRAARRRLHREGRMPTGALPPRMAAKLAAGKLAAGKMARGAKPERGSDVAGGLEYGRPRALSLGGSFAHFNRHGTLWVSGQLIEWLFRRMHPSIRREVDRRRMSVLPRVVSPPHATTHPQSTRPLCIAMHVRRGDSCSLGSRFCPRNFTATYFAAAARLRRQYGINRLVVATDDAGAADMCARGALGFDCRTMAMDRVRFDARQSIERRVIHHPTGLLSGSAVSLDALADVEMLSDCDAHVLVLRSAVSRLALALSVARKGFHSPLISLQWPWGGMPGPS